jgi:hypothetical protein
MRTLRSSGSTLSSRLKDGQFCCHTIITLTMKEAEDPLITQDLLRDLLTTRCAERWRAQLFVSGVGECVSLETTASISRVRASDALTDYLP